MDETDWFGEFQVEQFGGIDDDDDDDDIEQVQKVQKVEKQKDATENCWTSGKDVIHKRGLNLDMSRVIEILYEACDPEKVSWVNDFVQYLVLHTYGKRNIRKDAVSETMLSEAQKEVYNRIRGEMKNPLRRQRILSFINAKDITKRLINYFVVHYSLMEREISYYLDKTTYPYKVVGDFNSPDQPDILARKEKGENIVWINLHQEYKNSKNKNGRRNQHAPYRRSISVQGADGNEYSLCELNFYLWLDDIGGFEIFYLFEVDIREKKSLYDEKKRIQETMVVPGKKKKKKIVLRNTDGRNYKTHVIHQITKAPYSVWQSHNGELTDYLEYLEHIQTRQERKFLDPEPSNKRYKVDPTVKKPRRKTPQLDLIN